MIIYDKLEFLEVFESEPLIEEKKEIYKIKNKKGDKITLELLKEEERCKIILGNQAVKKNIVELKLEKVNNIIVKENIMSFFVKDDLEKIRLFFKPNFTLRIEK